MDVSAGARLVEERDHSCSLWELYEQSVPEGEVNRPLLLYYERLMELNSAEPVSLAVHRDIYLGVQSTVDRSTLKKWAHARLPDAAHFWQFRKNLTHHMALLFLAEYALFLTSVRPEALMIEADTGRCFVEFFKFCSNERKGELEGNRAVPARLTPNLAELITPWGLQGPLVASVVAAARCLGNQRQQFSAYLRASLRDEYIVWHRLRTLRGVTGPGTEVDLDSDTIVSLVVKAVQMISSRLHSKHLIVVKRTKMSLAFNKKV